MKKNSVKFILTALVFAVVFSSCATKKKYGCPGHISIENILGF